MAPTSSASKYYKVRALGSWAEEYHILIMRSVDGAASECSVGLGLELAGLKSSLAVKFTW